MRTIRITGVSDALDQRLKQHAAAAGRSVEEQVIVMLQRALAHDRLMELARPSTPPGIKPVARTGTDRPKRKRRR